MIAVSMIKEKNGAGKVPSEVQNSDSESLSSQITVYMAKWCGACKKRVPIILRKAQDAGLRVKLVDWDDDLSDEDRERLADEVEFVPFID